MLTFTEEILLLLLDDDDGSFVPISKANLSCALAGAALMDLAFAYRIDTDPKALVVNDPTPTGNPMLDRILEKIAAGEESADTRTWIRVLSVEDAPDIREQALESLVARGILVQRETRVLWAFRARRYPTIEGNAEQEVRLRIADVLFSDDIPDPRDVALIGLVDACDILGEIFSPQGVGAMPTAHRAAAQDGPDRPRAGRRDRRYRAHRHDGPLGGALLARISHHGHGLRGAVRPTGKERRAARRASTRAGARCGTSGKRLDAHCRPDSVALRVAPRRPPASRVHARGRAMRASTVGTATLFGPLLADRTPGRDAGRDHGEKGGLSGAAP